MKIKVTVEFEDGLKATSEQSVTTELVMMSHFNTDKKALENTVLRASEDAAARSTTKILNFIREHGILAVRFNEDVNAREALRVTDVDEANYWLKQGKVSK